MCTISNKIKFCTCKATSTNTLKHYWALYRRNKDKNEITVGEVLLPYEFDPNFKSNYSALENRLKDADTFDIPINFKDRDVLKIVFNNHSTRVVYGFEYMKEEWVRYEIDNFYLMGHFDEVGFGKIINPRGKIKKE